LGQLGKLIVVSLVIIIGDMTATILGVLSIKYKTISVLLIVA